MNLLTLQIKHLTAERRWQGQSKAFWRRYEVLNNMDKTSWTTHKKAKFWRRSVSFKKRVYLRITEAALYKMVAYNQNAAA